MAKKTKLIRIDKKDYDEFFEPFKENFGCDLSQAQAFKILRKKVKSKRIDGRFI